MATEEEKEFNDWMDSIEFVDKTGKPSSHILAEDDSPDLDYDRE